MITNLLVRILTSVKRATLVTALKSVATRLVAITVVANPVIIEIQSPNLVRISMSVKLVNILAFQVNVVTTPLVVTHAYV